jgi:hypothetical protein
VERALGQGCPAGNPEGNWPATIRIGSLSRASSPQRTSRGARPSQTEAVPRADSNRQSCRLESTLSARRLNNIHFSNRQNSSYSGLSQRPKSAKESRACRSPFYPSTLSSRSRPKPLVITALEFSTRQFSGTVCFRKRFHILAEAGTQPCLTASHSIIQRLQPLRWKRGASCPERSRRAAPRKEEDRREAPCLCADVPAASTPAQSERSHP